MSKKKMLFVLALAAWMRFTADASAAAAPRTNYCGDGICQEEGCDINGNETPGNGCRESPYNCPDDCGEPPGGGCSPNWVATNVIWLGSHNEDTWGWDYSTYPPFPTWTLLYCESVGSVHVTMHDANNCGDDDYGVCYFNEVFGHYDFPPSENYCCGQYVGCGESEYCVD